MVGAPLLVLGLVVTLSAVLGARVTGRDRGAVVGFLLGPLDPATWAAAASILVGLFITVLGFTAVAGFLSAGASVLVAGIGFVFVGVGVEAARIVARAERARARWADSRPLHPHGYRPYGDTLRSFLSAVFLDVARWRDVVYVLVAFPLALLEAIAVVVLWALAVVLLSLPLQAILGTLPVELSRVPVPADTLVTAATLAGLVLLPVASAVTQGLMTLHRAVIAGLLCESEQRALERRVATLESSRRAVLDVEASELRRIERDLHDGAQQRLVMLAINLGLAAERIDEDPSRAKELVVDARDQARQALAELRDLVRGIAPTILLDRGLVAALSALAGRSPVPTVVASSLPDGLRLPDAVERAAYFVVAEAMANVAKHAGATRVEIRCRIEGGRAGGGAADGGQPESGRLVVEVEDDGTGGAQVVPGGGLAGLVGRVEALDGLLEVVSPTGGPTVVRAVIGVPEAAVAQASI